MKNAAIILAAVSAVVIVIAGIVYLYTYKPPAPPQPATTPKKEPQKDEFAPFARIMDAKRWNEFAKDIRRNQILSGKENNENVLRGGTDWRINDILNKQEWNVTYRCTLFVDNDPQEVMETIAVTTGDDAMTIMHFGILADKAGAWIIHTKSHSITKNDKEATKTEARQGMTPLIPEEAEAQLARCKEFMELIAGSR